MNTHRKNIQVAIIAGTLGQGGAERQLVYILQAMRLLEFHVTVYVLTEGEHYEQAVRDAGAELVHIRQKGRFARFAEIPSLVRKQNPDLIFSMHFFTNVYAWIAGKIAGVPSVGSLRSNCIKEVGKLGILGKPSLKLPGVVAANSRTAIRNAVDMGMSRQRLFFLPNIVDTETFHPEHHRPGRDAFRIVFIGRMDDAKRVDRFIRLVDRLRKQEKIACRIYGAGQFEQDARQQANALHLQPPELEFMGPASDMPAVYAEADLVVMTSDYEGTPNVILEAQSAGVPVISTAVGGVPDIVEHNVTGVLVPAADEDLLYTETLALLRDSGKREALARNAREHIERQFSMNALLENLRRLFRHAGIAGMETHNDVPDGELNTNNE